MQKFFSVFTKYEITGKLTTFPANKAALGTFIGIFEPFWIAAWKVTVR